MSQSTLTPIHLCSSARRLEGRRGPATVRCAVKLLSMVKMMGLQPAYSGDILYDGWNPLY